MSDKTIKTLLVQKFAVQHINACLKHFESVTDKYVIGEWDVVALKAGKFVEAVTKALMIYCGKNPSTKARDFKASEQLRQLAQIPKENNIPDEIRIVIPKACIFIYEIVNNRGGRHDAIDIDANSMDATAIMPLISWIVAEMVRFCSSNNDTSFAMRLIEELTTRKYPFFEEIDGRSYVNIDNLSAPDYALLLLYHKYPKRINRQELINLVIKNGATKNAASVAVSRLKCVDDDNDKLKLRGIGRTKAEALLSKLNSRN
ncbi:MAG: hypothetical protein V1746_01295 [bacterium]